ncbi:hypothetical protein N8301_05915 [Cyclobacteriaceae bacterium]|nr:hypothetical protein [Cyclobacteriaceae bacterium]
MSKLPKPLSNYVDRFNDQYHELGLEKITQESLEHLILNSSTKLNNLFMSGLGASTLILRLGAVIQLSKRLEEGDADEDALLLKQILENLREILPTDTNWKTVWRICCHPDSKWSKCIESEKGKQSLMERFVTFRNKFVHETIMINQRHVDALEKGIELLYEICTEVSDLYVDTYLKEKDGKYFFIEKGKEISLYPFVQKGESDGLPYIFQGLYKNKSSAELISTFHGDIQKQNESNHYDTLFDPMRNLLKGGAGKVFDHQNRLEYYNECFVGRDKESQAIYDWATSDIDNNILPVFSQAGMGKGALIADMVLKLSHVNIPVLYHFCGSGIANNLHAIVYHFILMGKKMQLWNTDNEELKKKIEKLPSKYTDIIMLFHMLLDECFTPTRKNTFGNLVVIVDGLDEAAVSFPEYNIKDYFSNYDDNGVITGSWNSNAKTKWIFTFREGFYQFPNFETKYDMASLQPLLGLEEEAVISSMASFNPSKEFVSTVIERGKVST